MLIRLENLKLQLPKQCHNPFVMIRGFGKYAYFFKKNKEGIWKASHPVFGNVTIDITLLECDSTAVNESKCTSFPRTIYRQTHNFENKEEDNGFMRWHRVGRVTTMDTRYQTKDCYETSISAKNCSRSPIDSYAIHFPQIESPRTHLCFLGASHAERMAKHAIDMGFNLSRHISLKFAKQLKYVNPTRLQGCDHTFLHVGQWDLGWPDDHITSPETFRNQITRGVEILKQYHYPFSIVSNNYNPIGYPMLRCPPHEWRRVNYIDLYNGILQDVANLHHIKYIDNNFEISGVAWDSASDWCHYDPKVMKAVVVNTYLNTFS